MWDASKGHDSVFMPPTSITVLGLSAYVGLLAVGATLNMLLGLLMTYRYSPHRSWPHRRFNYFRLHKWMGYVALGVSILHPAILLASKNPRFRILDLAYPVHSPSQPLDNTIGAIAIYLLAFVAVTSYIRIRLGRHLWKAFSVYFAAAALFWHSLFTDPALKSASMNLVRWRQILRRVLRAPHRRRQPATPSLRSQERLPRPPIQPLTDTYGTLLSR